MSTDAISPELFAQIRAIQVRTQRLVTSLFAGEYESAFKGRGMEFDQVREYLPGDDVRHIDWNVTARTGKPHIKQHKEERELTVVLMVDVSSSGSFGSQARAKRDIAAEIAAVLAYTAIRSNDRVGLVVFSDHVEKFVPPKKGRAHVWRVIREVLTHTPVRQGTRIDAALELVGHVLTKSAVIFLISDFIDQGFEDRLRVTARRHDLTAVSITDPRELSLPAMGFVALEDAETGEVQLVDTSSRAVREHYEKLARERLRRRSELFRSAGVGEIAIDTARPYIDELVRYFRAREHR